MNEGPIRPRTYIDGGDDKSDWGGNLHRDYSPITDFLNSISKESFIFSEIRGGVFKVSYQGKTYYFWPKSNKWRAEGSTTIYRAKDVRQFLSKFVFKEGTS